MKDFKVTLVNGKWYDIIGDNPISIPQARNLIDSYPNVTRIDYPNHHEWESRNMYLEACSADDVLIWLDTDEYMEHGDQAGIWRFYPIQSVGSLSFFVKGYDKRCGGDVILKRGYYSPSITRHKDRHNESWIGKKKLTFKSNPLIDFKIIHDKSHRSKQREETMKVRNHLRPFR